MLGGDAMAVVVRFMPQKERRRYSCCSAITVAALYVTTY